MCRNIKILHNFKPPATDEEIRASSLQFVRKLSGFTKPSQANQLAFAGWAVQALVVSEYFRVSGSRSRPRHDSSLT